MDIGRAETREKFNYTKDPGDGVYIL